MNQTIAKARSPLDVSERWGAWMRGLTLVISLAVTAVALAACGRANGEDKGGKGGFPPAPVTRPGSQDDDGPHPLRVRGPDRGLEGGGSTRACARAFSKNVCTRKAASVNAGQALFVLDSRPYAAQVQAAEAELARAQAQYAQAKRNFDRVKPLIGSNALSQREFDEATADEESGAAAVKQAQARLTEARLNLGYTRVSSAGDGMGEPRAEVRRFTRVARCRQFVDDDLAARSAVRELQCLGSRAAAAESPDEQRRDQGAELRTMRQRRAVRANRQRQMKSAFGLLGRVEVIRRQHLRPQGPAHFRRPRDQSRHRVVRCAR